MFTGPNMQTIKDGLTHALNNGWADTSAQAIIDFCDTNIKAVCPKCGGDGMMDVKRDGDALKDFQTCDKCAGTGKGPSFDALVNEMGERNAKVQHNADKKLKKNK